MKTRISKNCPKEREDCSSVSYWWWVLKHQRSPTEFFFARAHAAGQPEASNDRAAAAAGPPEELSFLGAAETAAACKKKEETSKVPTGNETSWISNGDEKKCSSCLSFSLIIIIKEAMQIFLGTSIGIGGAAIAAGIQEERMPN